MQPACLEALAHRGCGVNIQLRPLAQKKQPEDVIEVRIRQQDAGQTALTEPHRPGMQRPKAIDLAANIRRGVDEEPRLPVRAYRDPGLGLCGQDSISRRFTIEARTIPLWKAASSRAAQQTNLNENPLISSARGSD